MKKIVILILSLILVLSLCSCNKKEKLYILNVGDYIEKDLIALFEEKYDCTVVYTEVNSNEEIYQKLKNEVYDICCVSDYMIDRMYQEDLLEKLEYTKIDNFAFDNLFSDAKTMIDKLDYKEYFIPYFWGTVGILYSLDVEGLEDYVVENGLNAIFSENEYNKGMYNSSRDVICMALMAMGEDINESDPEILKKAKDLVKSVTYRAWGDDNLKAMVHQGMLDMALVYSGDYLDEAYQCENNDEEVNFGYYAPDKTNIWFDGLCVLKHGKNKDLAYKFLNFMSEEENGVVNADYIGYAPVVENVFKDVLELWEYSSDETDTEGYLEYQEFYDFFYPYMDTRKNYKYVSLEHYNMLNDLLEESKSK